MRTWDTVTKEELMQEIIPGGTEMNLKIQNQLNWAEYLRHMRDMLQMGLLSDPFIAREHLEDVVTDIYMNIFHIIEDRYPEPDEIDTYIRGEYAQKTINNLLEVALGLTEENWPEFKEKMCKEVGLDPNEF